MYWLGVYVLIAGAVFSMAGLLILALFVCFELQSWLQQFTGKATAPVPIGITVVVPSPLANGKEKRYAA